MHFYSTSKAYDDTIESLKYEFRNDKTNRIIICGAHELSKKTSIRDFKRSYSQVIVFNQEPLLATQRQFMHFNYFQWMCEADCVWDYDELNANVLADFIPNIELHILKPYKKWTSKHMLKDIDILFYGSMNAHRKRLLDQLRKRYKVVTPFAYGDSLDSYILRSKVLLNVHYYYECAMQEQARMVRWLGSPCRIVSEKSHSNYFNVEEYSYNNLFSLDYGV